MLRPSVLPSLRLPVLPPPSTRAKPRVLFLDHVGVLGGAEFFLIELAKRYAPQGVVILFAHGPLERKLAKAGVAYEVQAAARSVTGVSRSGRGLAQLKAVVGVIQLAWRLARRMRQFDLVFANSQKAFVVGALAAWIARKPLVWYLHDILTAAHFSSFNRRLAVMLANRFAARVVTNSEASREAFVEAGGKRSLTAVVYNGIDASPTDETDKSSGEKIRMELGTTEGQPVVAVFSRLAPWKGQSVLIEAARQLPQVQVWIIGEALFGGEAKYEFDLRLQVQTSGLSERVHFLGFREDVPALLQAVDVVVHTSISPEPFGRVIVEGMLAGKPVVATRAGGACEIIEDRVTGRLVTPGDAKELAQVLGELLEDPLHAAKLAQAGRTAAQDRFSTQAMADGLEREFAAVLEKER